MYTYTFNLKRVIKHLDLRILSFKNYINGISYEKNYYYDTFQILSTRRDDL